MCEKVREKRDPGEKKKLSKQSQHPNRHHYANSTPSHMKYSDTWPSTCVHTHRYICKYTYSDTHTQTHTPYVTFTNDTGVPLTPSPNTHTLNTYIHAACTHTLTHISVRAAR